jgi:carbon monoxide dehydrogenase subunit G
MESTDDSLKSQLKIELKITSSSPTRLRLGASLEAVGTFQMVVNQTLRTQLDKILREFSACFS